MRNTEHHIRQLAIAQGVLSLGYQVLLPVLAIVLSLPPYNFDFSQVGIIVGIYAFADRGFALLCPPLISKIGYRLSVALGSVLAGVAIAITSTIYLFIPLCTLAAIAGFGISLTSLGLRSYLGEMPNRDDRLTAFSTTFIGFNIGAGGAMVIAFLFPFREHGTLLMFIAGLVTSSSGLLFYLFITQTIVSPQDLKLRDYRKLVRWYTNKQHGARAAFGYVILMFLGIFLYTQLHEVLPIHFENTFGTPHFLGWAFALNPLLISLFQKHVTTIFKKLYTLWPNAGLAVGFFSFSLGNLYLIFAWSPHALWGLILFYTFAEMLIFPHMDYLISLHASKILRPYVYGISYTMAAAGRSLCASTALFYLHGRAEVTTDLVFTWWNMTTLLSIAVCGILVFYYIANRQRYCTSH